KGVIVSGLGLLYAATKDVNYLTEGEKTIDGVIAHRTVNGILQENCDKTNSCNHDQQEFKGIFIKHLMYYLDQVNGSGRTGKYASFLAAQSDAVKNFATNQDGDPGSLWYTAPSSSLGTTVSSWSVASGMAAHIAAAKYGGC
ncbi:glycoside hydrolase family 76 protein, partial [Mycena crocata]